MTSPEVLREALLLDNAYLYLFFASAVATSTLGLCAAAPRPRARRAHRRAGGVDRARRRGAATSWAA